MASFLVIFIIVSSNGDLPKLLSEWLTKGAVEIAEASNGRRRKGTTTIINGNGIGTTAMKRAKMEDKIEHQQNGHKGRGGQHEGRNGPNCSSSSASDQFEIFGIEYGQISSSLPYFAFKECSLPVKFALCTQIRPNPHSN
jgi:hypothetical protein